MTDYAELKRLADACGDLNWRAIQENWCEWAIRDDHAYIATMRTKSAKHPGPCPDREAKAKFLCAVTPSVVRALIEDSERQAARFKEWQASHHSNYVLVAEERDQLKAENERLRNESADALAVNRTIRQQLDCYVKDAERYRWLRINNYYAHVQVMEADGSMPFVYAEEMDASIDAAISNGGRTGYAD